jgi:hypothetical protein
MKLVEMLQNPLIPPIQLAKAVTKTFGERWMGWDPEVLDNELHDELNLHDRPRENLDKLQAMRFIKISNSPWTNWHVFSQSALALNGVPINVNMAAMPSPAHIAYAVDVMQRVAPKREFSQEVIWLMAAMLFAQGYVRMPESGEGMESDMGDLVNHALSVLCKRNGGDDVLDDAEEIEEAEMRAATIDTYLKAKHDAERRIERGEDGDIA